MYLAAGAAAVRTHAANFTKSCRDDEPCTPHVDGVADVSAEARNHNNDKPESRETHSAPSCEGALSMTELLRAITDEQSKMSGRREALQRSMIA